MSSLDFLLSGLFFVCSAPQDDLKGWIAELSRRRDDADPALIQKIADRKSRPAMEGLISAYDVLQSIYMRREVVRALVEFDGVAAAEQPALAKIADIATSSEEPELREAAVEALGKCSRLGKHFLARIVDSKAHDDLRLMALRFHVKRASKADVTWYRRVWNPERERRNKTKGVDVPELEAIRELAFDGLSPHVGDKQLVETLRSEFNPRIRCAALVALRDRDSAKAPKMAMWLFKRTDIPGTERIEAAEILAKIQGPRIVQTFLSLAKKQFVTPEDLRQKMAALIVKMNDKAVNKRVTAMVGRGKPHERIFALLATVHLNDPKLLKRIRRGFNNKSFAVRRATAKVLALRGNRDSLPELHKMIRKPRTPDDARVAIEAISTIEKGAVDWIRQLGEFCGHKTRDIRNAALDQLGKTKDSAHLPKLTESLAHADWTTRLVAIRGLEAMRHKSAIPLLIARLSKETGRMAKVVADALWSLTGQLFEQSGPKWRAWWDAEGDTFTVISPEKLAKAEQEREVHRLRQRTRAKARFFGIRLVSQRVIFIIDTSGSMVYPVHGRFVGKRGAMRIDVAKEELAQCIKNLAPGSLFNIISFSLGVGRWIKGGIGGTAEHTREDALTFVERLGAGGATNLYDTLKLAFEDPDVDTLFVLSDGEPTAGAVLDPHQIREDVKFWNRHRRIKINTIAIGGNLEILEWLAADSNGSHVKIR